MKYMQMFNNFLKVKYPPGLHLLDVQSCNIKCQSPITSGISKNLPRNSGVTILISTNVMAHLDTCAGLSRKLKTTSAKSREYISVSDHNKNIGFTMTQCIQVILRRCNAVS